MTTEKYDANTERVLREMAELPLDTGLFGHMVEMAQFESLGAFSPTRPYVFQLLTQEEREDGERMGWLRVEGARVMLTPKGREVVVAVRKTGRGV